MSDIVIRTPVYSFPVDPWLGTVFLLTHGVPLFKAEWIVVKQVIYSVGTIGHGEFSTLLVSPSLLWTVIGVRGNVVALVVTMIHLKCC